MFCLNRSGSLNPNVIREDSANLPPNKASVLFWSFFLAHFIGNGHFSLIRPTNENDFDALIDLATASGLFETDQTKILADMLRSPAETDVWFTDESESGPVGVAYMAPERMTNGTWNLYWIAVHPTHQRNGRGKAILQHVENWLSDKGHRILLVETSGTQDFEYVRQFYAKNGFTEEARIRDFYETNVDKVVYRKKLGKNSG